MTVTKFDVLLSKGAPAPSSAYSQGLAFGNLVVTSGYLGTQPDGSGLIPGGFERELRQALDNVTAVLAEAGCTWRNVIRINVSLIDDQHVRGDGPHLQRLRAPRPGRPATPSA